MQTWAEATEWERDWHGNCVNSLGEEYKQIAYAKRMGLKPFHNGKSPFNFDLKGASVLDIGGGPYSLLLKCENFRHAVVVDPCRYPEWVYRRYDAAHIECGQFKGEELLEKFVGVFDEIWIYNCLQHTENPELIIQNARKIGKIIRLFEWIETGVADGHLHNLTEEGLNAWLGGTGKVERINENTAVGLCYYGIFLGRKED
jgi:hypothetical protein